MTETSRYDPQLLPAADESVRCAGHARSIDLDPGGTALWIDELIVVDVGLPWPKPVWAKDGFTSVPELVLDAGNAGRRVRVLAAVPLDDGISRIITHARSGGGFMTRTEHHVDGVDVTGVLRRLLSDGLSAHPATEVASPVDRELLLCTQGSHDVCCGSRGAALVGELAASHPDLVVRRVSHTGGHRMAPTGMTLPDGRMWGMVDQSEMAAILDQSATPASLAHRCRGWTGAAEGPAQMAERAVLAAVDSWSFDAELRDVTVLETGEVTIVRVTTPSAAWTVEVQPGRAVPTIACGAPGGLPAKPGREWVVRSIARVPV